MADLDITVQEQVGALKDVLVMKDQQITSLQALNVILSRRLEGANAALVKANEEIVGLKAVKVVLNGVPAELQEAAPA